ncbi:RNA polymerase II subunit A C-terminal domain phosphatase [Pseudolycoriella hygida]|uniref:RNA polymerase II subunit A C-terminal domain phosphatase n=1 Tax=Pseudolycoriella hygida TaxID=35572 RepID=A0A9Q0N1S4_9DIPT|nr:RNA polymerase II subunit A C-terminal domain phosphatase [Pseudolycoriella hygida]
MLLADSEDTEIKRLKATNCGVVKKRLHKDGDVVPKGEPLLELSACVHTTVIKDMCADCGADLRQDEGNTSEASVPMIHAVPELKVTQKLAQKLGKADTARLLEEEKLVLLVDLDQTLIHTTNDNIPNNLKGVYHFQLYGPGSPWYHTRLRPGTFDFLSNMAPFFELHICTFGARNYAHTIAQFLDGDRKYFAHRILSRDECFNVTSKTDNLRALFPCGDSMVCIIDDREDVWNMASNLIQVKPYHFFQHTGDINAPPGLDKHELDGKGVNFKDTPDAKSKNSSSEKSPCEDDKQESVASSTDTITASTPEDTSKDVNDALTVEKPKTLDDPTKTSASEGDLIDVEDSDDYLLHLEAILKTIHTRFYSYYKENGKIPDLKMLIPKIRSEVLVGKTLVFSGLVPNHLKLEQSRAYLIAKGLGANVRQQLTSDTTHLVAVTAGTFKANAARKRPDIKIVTPDWLWSCAERWECVEEKLFPLDPSKPSKMRQPPPHCHSPEHVVNYSEINSRLSEETASSSMDRSEEEPKFLDTINPLLSFSKADLAAMDQEYDQFFDESDSSTDCEPVDLENPPIDKVLKKRRKKEEEKEQVQEAKLFRLDEAEDTSIKTTDKTRRNFDRNGSSSSSDSTDAEEKIDDGDPDEMPSARFRRGGDLPSDLDVGSDYSQGSEDPIDDDDGEWVTMGSALEREFFGLE